MSKDFPNLSILSTPDLLLLLFAYTKVPVFLERDKAFLKAIQKELKQRGVDPELPQSTRVNPQ